MSPTSAPMGDGEIARTLERLERAQSEARAETNAGLSTIGEKLDNRPTWADLDRVTATMQDDIDALEDGQRWATRAIVGAFLVGIAGVLWSGPAPLF